MSRKYLITLLLALVAVQTTRAQKMAVTLRDGQTILLDVADVVEVRFMEEEPEHEWVDLALPSGTLWATCNVGASSPTDCGDYFAWGETAAKTTYNYSTYSLCDGSFYTMNKYCTNAEYGTPDGLTELLPEDDAATVLWGNDWQMPNASQMEELVNEEYTMSWWWTQPNGVSGLLITSRSNQESLFLPAAGSFMDSAVYGREAYGYYLSRSLSTEASCWATVLDFDKGGVGFDGSSGSRELGRSVRPVRKASVNQ